MVKIIYEKWKHKITNLLKSELRYVTQRTQNQTYILLNFYTSKFSMSKGIYIVILFIQPLQK